jgi:hypothetical protein
MSSHLEMDHLATAVADEEEDVEGVLPTNADQG